MVAGHAAAVSRFSAIAMMAPPLGFGAVGAAAMVPDQPYAADLTGRLAAAGIATERPIGLLTQPDGSIGVTGAGADKVAIERIFAADPDLVRRFHQISTSNDGLAATQLSSRYAEDWASARGNAVRLQVWQRYRTLGEQVSGLLGHMTLAEGRLSSASLRLAKRWME